MASDDQGGKATGGTSAPFAVPAARDLTGRLIGDFRFERLLGRGGMGEVYLGRQLSLDRPVALKVLKPEWATDPIYMARFEGEAWAAAKFNHPNIVHIYSIGGEDDIRFIAMEYVSGVNLGDFMKKKGVVDLPFALAILRQVGLAVMAAGEEGLTHRDIKPDNLLMTKRGQVKVTDFGLAQHSEPERLQLTRPGTVLGTPMYMSPEQVQGHQVDHRSDLYSLGVTLYHMLAGEPPFRADTAVAMALKHVHEPAPSLADKRPDLPPELVAIVTKLMQKKPSDRYGTAAEMLRDLAIAKEAVQRTMHGVAKTLADGTPISSTQDAEADAESDPDPAKSSPPGWRPNRGVAIAVGVVALLAGGVAGWFARGEDILDEKTPVAIKAPALWMAEWEAIPAQRTAEAQYRYAQTRSSPYDRDAAWLAVPGRFPKDAELCFSSYVQLARYYLRMEDGERLGALGRAIQESEKARESPRERWLELARVAQAGRAALTGEAREVASMFKEARNYSVLPPTLVELTLEVATVAADGMGEAASAPIQAFRLQLLGPLRLTPVFLDPVPPPGG